MPISASELGGVLLERDVSAAMRDGTELFADIYRPAEPGSHPALLLRTPYDKAIAQTSAYAHPAWYARHGYVVVVQDVRGRFQSSGSFVPFDTEAADGYDSVQWASRLDGTNGDVGMYGFSYSGAAAVIAAAQRPPALRCIAPASTTVRLNSGWVTRGGVVESGFLLHWLVDLLGLPQALARGEEALAAALAKIKESPAPPATQSLLEYATEHHDLIGAAADLLDHASGGNVTMESAVKNLEVPVLSVGGWFDCFAAGTLADHRNLPSLLSSSLVMGPWLHSPWAPLVGKADFGVAADGDVDLRQVAWLDHWLKPQVRSTETPPAGQAFICGNDEWVDIEDWRLPDAEDLTWHLHSTGRAASSLHDGVLDQQPPQPEMPDVFVFDPTHPAPTHGGSAVIEESVAAAGVQEQRPIAVRPDVAVYTSPPLGEDIQVLGEACLVLYASTDAADTDWMVTLVDVAPNGSSSNVTDGVQRVTTAGSSPRKRMSSGYECTIRLAPVGYAFKAGHRLRLQVTNSSYPRFEINCGDGSPPGQRVQARGRPVMQSIQHEPGRSSKLVIPRMERCLQRSENRI